MKAWIRDGSLSHITLECVRGLSADQNTLDAIAHRAGRCEGWVIFFLCPIVCVGASVVRHDEELRLDAALTQRIHVRFNLKRKQAILLLQALLQA